MYIIHENIMCKEGGVQVFVFPDLFALLITFVHIFFRSANLREKKVEGSSFQMIYIIDGIQVNKCKYGKMYNI